VRKLHLKPGMELRVLGKPASVKLAGVKTTSSNAADGVLVFVKKLAELERKAGTLVGAAQEERLAWVAYPKAGQLGTDLNRDIVWKHMRKYGVQAVRQIAIDEVWSALRFRPGP
jgi:hypothetical protein